MDIGLTHVARPVTNLETSLVFYAKYAAMRVVHRRPRQEQDHLEVAWLSDLTRPFVLVLVETTEMESPLGPFAHLGVACGSRAAIDALCEEASREGCLRDEPTDIGGPAGYLAALSDPDGHTLELSFGQDTTAAVERAQDRTSNSSRS